MSALFSTGSNARGQLASGNFEDLHTFSAGNLPNNVTILSIATGSNHTLALSELETGTGLQIQLWGAGDGVSGQLGPSYKVEQLQHGHMGQTRFCPISLPLEALGLEECTPKLIAATWETSYVVLCRKNGGDVILSMGSNDFGDLGTGMTGSLKDGGIHVVSLSHLSSPNGTPIRDGAFLVKQVSTGQRHVIALIEVLEPRINPTAPEVFLVGWGSARHGQLGQQSKSAGSPSPLYVPLPTLVTLPQSGLAHNEAIQMMALGMHHSVFLTSSGRLLALGSNRKNQLDLAMNPPSGKILSIGSTWNGTYAVVQKDNALVVYSSGSNTHGQLGRGFIGQNIGGVDNVTLPLGLDAREFSIQIACGTEHVLALIVQHRSDDELHDSQQLWAWGWNEHGNLGTGSTSDVDIPTQVWSSTQEPALGHHLKQIKGIKALWAGCGTTWMACQVDETMKTP